MVSVRDMPYTVTNSFKRGLTMKTYGGAMRRVLNEESRPATKKRRIQQQSETVQDGSENNLECAIRESSAAILSSPSRHASTVFSEDIHDHDHDNDNDDLSTLPSSPPATLQLTPPPASMRKPTFSFLKRKRSSASTNNGTPLAEVNVNSNSLHSSVDSPSAKSRSRQPSSQQPQPQSQPQSQTPSQPPLKQMQIDLGGDIRKTCATCGMEYVPSSGEDAALHKKFHEMNSNGVDLGKAFVRANASRWVYEAARFDEGYVVIVDRKSSASAKNQARRVLEVVNKDLSAADIDEATLWSKMETPKRFRKNGCAEEIDRFKVFLHMKDSKCVGLCLVERIWESHPVQRIAKDAAAAADGNSNGKAATNNPASKSSSISMRKETHPALVGISRVWTSASSRRKGIAMDLLDCVVGNYFYGIEIPKAKIAFSQPTESGCRLLEAFFGSDEDWHVYKEE